MIVNTTPGAVEWNKAVNEINIVTHERYRKIDGAVREIEEAVSKVREANARLETGMNILKNKLDYLKLFVEAYA